MSFNILIEEFGAQLDTQIYRYLPLALKLFDSSLNLTLNFKRTLVFLNYKRRNMNARLLRSRAVNINDQFVIVDDLSFEQERNALLLHTTENIIVDTDFPSQASATVLKDWTDITPNTIDTIFGAVPLISGFPETRLILIIRNFSSSDNRIKYIMFPNEKEFIGTLDIGQAIAFYTVVPANGGIIYFMKALVFSSGFKYKIITTTQSPKYKSINITFQEFSDKVIPPTQPISDEMLKSDDFIYLFNLSV